MIFLSVSDSQPVQLIVIAWGIILSCDFAALGALLIFSPRPISQILRLAESRRVDENCGMAQGCS
jgi:hypothetical protein